MTHVCPFNHETRDFPEAPVDFHLSGQNCITWPDLAVTKDGKGMFCSPSSIGEGQGRRGLRIGLGLTEKSCLPRGAI